MENRLSDLNNRLFLLIDQLTNPEQKDEDQMEMIIARSKAASAVAAQIVDTHKTALEEAKFIEEYMGGKKALPRSFRELTDA